MMLDSFGLESKYPDLESKYIILRV
jgi:hypothetical protein